MEGERVGIGADAVIFRSNQERALMTLKDEAAVRVKQKGVDVQTEESARYDSRGNGLAETGVKAVKDEVRTLILVDDASCGFRLDGNTVLMPYFVRYCGSMLHQSLNITTPVLHTPSVPRDVKLLTMD